MYAEKKTFKSFLSSFRNDDGWLDRTNLWEMGNNAPVSVSHSLSLLCNILIYNLFVSLLNTVLLSQFKVLYRTILGDSETLLTWGKGDWETLPFVCLFFLGGLSAPML